MLVGVSEETAAACSEQLNPIPVLRVGHVAATAERVAVTRPLVVVVGEAADGDVGHLADLGRGAGCEIIHLADLGATNEVPRKLEQIAVACARRRSGQFVAVEVQAPAVSSGVRRR
jgi:hypothetical protein